MRERLHRVEGRAGKTLAAATILTLCTAALFGGQIEHALFTPADIGRVPDYGLPPNAQAAVSHDTTTPHTTTPDTNNNNTNPPSHTTPPSHATPTPHPSNPPTPVPDNHGYPNHFPPLPSQQAINAIPNRDAPISPESAGDSWGPYFNQRDSRWYYAGLGNSQIRFGSEGCVATDIAMIWSHLTNRLHTPTEVNNHKEWFNGSGIPQYGFPTLDGHHPQLTNPDQFGGDYHAYTNSLRDQILHHHASIILELQYWDPKQNTFTYHYVVARGVTPDGKFLINDPWFGYNMDVRLENHWGDSTITESWTYV